MSQTKNNESIPEDLLDDEATKVSKSKKKGTKPKLPVSVKRLDKPLNTYNTQIRDTKARLIQAGYKEGKDFELQKEFDGVVFGKPKPKEGRIEEKPKGVAKT